MTKSRNLISTMIQVTNIGVPYRGEGYSKNQRVEYEVANGICFFEDQSPCAVLHVWNVTLPRSCRMRAASSQVGDKSGNCPAGDKKNEDPDCRIEHAGSLGAEYASIKAKRANFNECQCRDLENLDGEPQLIIPSQRKVHWIPVGLLPFRTTLWMVQSPWEVQAV